MRSEMPPTGCPDCGTDHVKHAMHRLKAEHKANSDFAHAVGLAIKAFVPTHSRDLTDGLAPALAAFLNSHVEMEMMELKSVPYSPYQMTPEDLIQASNSLQKLEEQKARNQEALDKVPEELKDVMGFAASIMTSMLDQQIESAKEYVNMVQRNMESAANADADVVS